MVLAPGEKFLAIRPGSGKQEPHVLWEAKLTTGYCSPAYHQGRVYALSSRGVLQCADAATGKLLWDQRLQGAYAASPLIADGKVYLVSEDGTTTVMQEGAEAKIVATNPLKDTILASPVASDRAILLRSDKYVYCVGEKK
jgi:outer membrane protein assembly factor BamB